MLLYLLSPRKNTNHDQYFSISPQKTNRPGDIIKGKTYRNLNVTRKLRVGDIPELIIAALQVQEFALGSMTYRQVQGSPMGSPLSPALCLMVVSLSEQLWHRTYSQMISNSHFTACMLRYVDNRLIVLPPSLATSFPFTTLLDPGFYGAPIILEDEPDQEFLGFQVEFEPFEIRYNPPQCLNKIISPISASPPSFLQSGFLSRAHLISKGSYPRCQIQQGLDSLTALFLRAGYKADDLHRLRSRVEKGDIASLSS